MYDNHYEIFYTLLDPIKYITIDCIVNIEWEDEERKMEVSVEEYVEEY